MDSCVLVADVDFEVPSFPCSHSLILLYPFGHCMFELLFLQKRAKTTIASSQGYYARLSVCLIITLCFSVSLTFLKGHDETKPFEMNKPSSLVVQQAAIRLERLRIVTMNVAGCIASRSASQNWKDARKAIKEEVLRTNPDIVALQECPRDWPQFEGYSLLGRTPAHADDVVLLVKNGIVAEPVEELDDHLPAVAAQLSFGNRSIHVASVHLAPFKEGYVHRQLQLGMLTHNRPLMLVAGDTNMRTSEDLQVEALGLVDFWKLNGSRKEVKFTWDTIDYGDRFNRFYGASTRKYLARYDRIYATNGFRIMNAKITVASFDLIANQPVTNRHHFMSDHFGITSEFQIEWVE